MLGKLVRRFLLPKDEIVRWSPTITGHSGNEERKQLFHNGIYLTVTAPIFHADETWVHFAVHNESHKALGLGAAGIHLLAGPNAQPVRCNVIRTGGSLEGREHTSVMVDAGRSETDVLAFFDPMPKFESLCLCIEMKWIFAPHLLFMIPFKT